MCVRQNSVEALGREWRREAVLSGMRRLGGGRGKRRLGVKALRWSKWRASRASRRSPSSHAGQLLTARAAKKSGGASRRRKGRRRRSLGAICRKSADCRRGSVECIKWPLTDGFHCYFLWKVELRCEIHEHEKRSRHVELQVLYSNFLLVRSESRWNPAQS